MLCFMLCRYKTCFWMTAIEILMFITGWGLMESSTLSVKKKNKVQMYSVRKKKEINKEVAKSIFSDNNIIEVYRTD